jgi:carbamoyl-phosphate synthase large subunit
MKVLVTGAGALLGQGVIRSLQESKLSVDIIAADPTDTAAGLYWTERRYVIPMANDPSYIARISALLERERPDAIFVGTDVELPILAEHREQLEATYRCRVVVSSPRVVAIADDKYLTYKFLSEAGFDPPRSALPGDEDALIESVGFPLIVKPRVGARSVGVELVRNREELRRALQAEARVVIQECVGTEADEYTAGTLTFEGRCEATIVMRRDLRDGNTYRAFVEEFPELKLRVRAMAERLGAYGPANFQFRHVNGRVAVFEINARFSGTTPLRMRAGFNEVEMILRRELLGETIQQPRIEPMTILRYWSETVVPAGSTVEVI